MFSATRFNLGQTKGNTQEVKKTKQNGAKWKVWKLARVETLKIEEVFLKKWKKLKSNEKYKTLKIEEVYLKKSKKLKSNMNLKEP